MRKLDVQRLATATADRAQRKLRGINSEVVVIVVDHDDSIIRVGACVDGSSNGRVIAIARKAAALLEGK